MRRNALAGDQASGLRLAFQRPGLEVLPVCVPGRDAASEAWVAQAAAAIADLGRRVVVLDAGPGLVAPALGLKARLELRHLLTGECAFEDVVLPAGPNLAVLPAPRGLEMFLASGEVPATLFGAFLALPAPASVLLATGPIEQVAPLVSDGDEILFVATPAPESITGVYAAIKRLEHDFPGRVARIAVAGVRSSAAGEALVARIAQATARFLGHQPEFAGTVVDHPALAAAARLGRPVVTHAPDSPPAEDFRRIAAAFADWRTAFHDSPLEG